MHDEDEDEIDSVSYQLAALKIEYRRVRRTARQAYVRITEDLLAGDAEGNTELAKLLAEIDPRVEALDAEVDKVANRIDRVRAKMQEQRAVREEDLLDKLEAMTNVLAALANKR
jgi:hypothetical protein